MSQWEGVFPVMTTPFNRDLSLDVAGLRANADFLARSEVDVLVCLGTEGEFYALTDQERRQVVEIVIDEVRGRKRVICGVSHPSTREAAALGRHAAETGAAAVMALAPYFVITDPAGIASYYASIAEASGVPTFIYNSPGRVGYNLSTEQILSLAEIEGICGVKQGSAEISELVALIGSRESFAVIGGAEISFWPALCAGADGNTATGASALPSYFVEMWQMSQAGNLRRGQEIYRELEPLRRAYRLARSQAPVVKRVAEMVGLAGGPVRPPLTPVPAEADSLLEPFVRRTATTP
jgi:4-hydroxy-tetrahydrodipicolinate synthase